MFTSADIKQRARTLGFDLCGIAPVGEFPELAALAFWLTRGYAGRMTYLNRTAGRRADIRHVLPSARSVIVVACLYNTDRPYSTEITDEATARIARYGWGDDYHRVMSDRLAVLLGWMTAENPAGFEAWCSVDDGPVQERVYAARAGLGWIGKHSCVINPELGSWIVLGEMATSLDLEPDTSVLDRCGTCTLCIEACPTRAIVEPYVLDARRCLSYLTIEIKGGIPVDQRADLGSHVFGCDICQDVCPYNATAPRSPQSQWRPRPGLDQPSLAEVWQRSDAEIERTIAGTPLMRRGVVGLRRNTAVALGNIHDRTTARVLGDGPSASAAPSLGNPVVAEHVEWARQRGR